MHLIYGHNRLKVELVNVSYFPLRVSLLEIDQTLSLFLEHTCHISYVELLKMCFFKGVMWVKCGVGCCEAPWQSPISAM